MAPTPPWLSNSNTDRKAASYSPLPLRHSLLWQQPGDKPRRKPIRQTTSVTSTTGKKYSNNPTICQVDWTAAGPRPIGLVNDDRGRSQFVCRTVACNGSECCKWNLFAQREPGKCHRRSVWRDRLLEDDRGDSRSIQRPRQR